MSHPLLRPTGPALSNQWRATAKNYALYSNEGGFYDEVAAYLRKRKLMR